MSEQAKILVSTIIGNSLFDENHIKEIEKYNDIIAEEIVKLKTESITAKYTEFEWKDLYARSKNSLPLKIALLKSLNLPSKYESKLVREIPKNLVGCIWESANAPKSSIIYALNTMFDEDLGVEDIRENIRYGILKPDKQVIGHLCTFPYQDKIEYLPFEFYEPSIDNDEGIFANYVNGEMENEYFWTAVANNKKMITEIRNKAMDNHFVLENIINITDEMAEEMARIYTESIVFQTESDFEKFFINEMAVDKLSILIRDFKLKEETLITVMNELEKDKSKEGIKRKRHIFLFIGKYANSIGVLKRVLEENPNNIIENKHLPAHLIDKYIEMTSTTISNEDVAKIVAHMILSSDRDFMFMPNFYINKIETFKDFNFYRKLFCSTVEREEINRMIENIEDADLKKHLWYMRKMRNHLIQNGETNNKAFICKVMKYIGQTDKTPYNQDFFEEISSHYRCDLNESYLTETEYKVLKNAIKDLKEMYPDMNNVTEQFENIVEKRYEASKLFNKFYGILFEFTEDKEKETSKGLIINIDNICNYRTEWRKTLLDAIKKETSQDVLFLIKDAIEENILDIPPHRMDEIYEKIYALKDIYYEINKKYKKLSNVKEIKKKLEVARELEI